MKVHRFLTYTLRWLTFILLWLAVSMSASLSAQNEVQINVHNTRNPMPANALAYVDQPGRFITLTLTNTTDQPLTGHFDMVLSGPGTLATAGEITVHPDPSQGSTIVNVTVPAHGTSVISGQNLNRLFERCRATDVYSSGVLSDALQAGMGKMGSYLVPEGRYRLTLTMVDDSRMALGSGFCEFDICYSASAPKIINNDLFIRTLYQKKIDDLSEADKARLKILKSLLGENPAFDERPYFQFPVNMPYRFEWEPSHLNLANNTGVRPIFYYDFELIEVLPPSTSLEKALETGTVFYRQRDLTTNFIDIPYNVVWDLQAKMKAQGNFLLLARVKAKPYKLASDIYTEDLQMSNDGYSPYAVVIVADFSSVKEQEEKKDEKDGGDDAPSVKAKILPVRNGLPTLPSEFFANPGAFITLVIENDNAEDIEVSLLPMLKGENDWCVMPGEPAQASHVDRSFTIDGKGYAEDAAVTTLTGAQLTRLMGGYTYRDLLLYFEDADRFGSQPDNRYPAGEKSVVVKVFKHDESAETIGEMNQIGKAEEKFEVKRAAGQDRNLTVTLEMKTDVELPDDAKLYFTNPGKYLNMTVTNSGDKDANVFVRLGLNQYGVTGDLQTITVPKNSSKTFNDEASWNLWKVADDDTTLKEEIQELTTSDKKPNLPLKLHDPSEKKKNTMRAALYEVTTQPSPQTGGNGNSGNSGNNTNTSGSSNSTTGSSSNSGNSSGSNSSNSSGGSTNTSQSQTITKIEWCDTDSCQFVPIKAAKPVAFEVKLKANVTLSTDSIMSFFKSPSKYFTMSVQRTVDNDPELKKFAVQMLFPHPKEDGKWLTTVIKNVDCSIPSGTTEYELEEGQVNNVAGKHTVEQLRSTDTLQYWTAKPMELKEGENEVLFRLCHVEDDGRITRYASTSLKLNLVDQKQMAKVSLTKRAGVSDFTELNVKKYLNQPEDFFDVKVKRLIDKELIVGMALTIDDKWTSIHPLTHSSVNMLKLTDNDEKTLSGEDVKNYLSAEDKNFYKYIGAERKEWKSATLEDVSDVLGNGEHKVVIRLYKMPRAGKAWNENTPHLVDSIRNCSVAADSMTFSFAKTGTIGVKVTLKNPKESVTDHLDRIYKKPSDYFEVSVFNRTGAEQTVRLAMQIDEKYTSVEPLLGTNAIKLEGRPEKPGLVRKDSLALSSEQVDILLSSVKKEHFREWTDYANNKWKSIEKPEEVRLAADATSKHKLQVMAYAYSPGQDNKDYGPEDAGKSMKDTLGMHVIEFKCSVDNTVDRKPCADNFEEITNKNIEFFGNQPAEDETRDLSRFTFKVAGGYEVTVSEAKIDHEGKVTGKGTFKWETNGGTFDIACEFNGIKINTDKVCFEGEVKSAKVGKTSALSYADAIPYSWFEEDALAGSRAEYIKRMKEAQGADNKMSDYYRYTKSGLMPVLGRKNTGNEGITLPAAVPVDMIASNKGGAVALGLLPVDVAILNVSLGPDHAWMNLVGTLTLPEVNTNQSKNIIMFGAPHICMQKGATATLLPPDGAMAMMTDYEMAIPSTDVTFSFIAPADWSDVMGGCYFGWKDGGFDVVTMKAGVTIPQLKAVNEKYEQTGENARAEVAFTFRDKENWGFGLSLDAFQLEDLEDFTFTPTGGEVGVYFDNSSKETPKGVAFPDKYDFTKVGFSENVGEQGKASKENTAPWKGLYIQQVEVRMPDWFSKSDSTAMDNNHGLTFGVKDVLIDKSGATISGYAADLGRYEMDGWKIALDTVALNFVQSKYDNFHLTGSFRAPIFNADLGFTAGVTQFTHPQTKKKGATIDFKIQQKDSMTFDIGIADIDFKKNNSFMQVGFNTVTKKAAVEVIIGGKISFKSPNPDVRIQMKDIKFAGMRLASFPKEQSSMYKSLVPQQEDPTLSKGAESEQAVSSKKTKFYFDGGRWSLASPQKALGPFCISLEDVNLKVDTSKPDTRLGIKLGISASVCDVFSAGGGFTVWGKLPEDQGLQFDCVSLDKLSVGTKISKITIAGEITAGDDGDITHGFSAQFDVGTPVFDLSIEGGYGQQNKSDEELEMDHQRGIVYPDSVYAWGYFNTKFESETLAKMQPFSLKGIQGGFYFNCDTEKTPRYRTFGMLVGAQCTIGGDTGVEGDAKCTMVYDLANKRCSNMLIDINAKGLGGMVDVNGQLVYANPDPDTEYLDLLVTVDAENNADALASKFFGTDVSEMSDLLNRANQAVADSSSMKGASVAKDVFNSFNRSDALASQASRTNLEQALGQKDNFGAGEHRSNETVDDNGGLVKMEVHIPFNLHVNLASQPKKWHIYIGEPDYAKRCQVTFIDFAAGGDAIGMSSKVYANAYLCFGNELPNGGALPDLPADIQEALFDKNSGNYAGGAWMEQSADSTISQAHDLFTSRADMVRQFGTDGGIMMGMELGGKVKVNAAVFYVDINIHAGLDVTMQKLAEGSHCANSDGYAGGAGGFYASGQLAALSQGEIGAIVNLFGFKGRVPIITASFAGMMQFGGPNPSWFYGTMKHKVSLLDGLVQFSVTSTTKAGSVCIPDHGNPLDEIKIFENVTPGSQDHLQGWSEKKKGESPYVVPTFKTLMPMGHSYTLVDMNRADYIASQQDSTNAEGYKDNSLREYRFVLGENKVNDFSLYLAQYEGDTINNRAVTVKSEDNINFTVNCGGPLAEGKQYALNLKAYAQEYCFRNGSSVKSWGHPIMKDEESNFEAVEREWSQEVRFFFHTDSLSTDILPEEVIAVARPGHGNSLYKNDTIYLDEARRPYLSLTNREAWDRLQLDGTMVYGKLVYPAAAQSAFVRQDSLELELQTVDDIYLVRPNGNFSINENECDGVFTYIIERIDNKTSQIDTLYYCPFTAYAYDNFAEEIKAMMSEQDKTIKDFPALDNRGVGSLLNITQKWNRTGHMVDAMNVSISDEDIYHDRFYASGASIPQHYMLSNPYLYMAYWANFGLIGSQSVTTEHPYFEVPIDNTYMEVRLNSPEYRNLVSYAGHLQAFPNQAGSYTAIEARNGLKPAMFYREHEGRQWGYESGRAWPAVHTEMTQLVKNDAILADSILGSIRPMMTSYYKKASISDSEMKQAFNAKGMTECIDHYDAEIGGGQFVYRYYQGILPFAITTAYGLSLSDVQTLRYGTGRSDDGTTLKRNMGVEKGDEYLSSATNWSMFPLSAAVNSASSDASQNYKFDSQRYLSSLDKYSYRLYRVSGYHTKRGASGYTVMDADILTNAYDIMVDAASGKISGSNASLSAPDTVKYLYISDLIVSTHSERELAQKALTDQGYSILPYDLNTGTSRGDAVYIGYKETTDPTRAITNVMVRIEDKERPSAASYEYDNRTYERVNFLGDSYGDLNSRAGGKYLYLYQTRGRMDDDKCLTMLDVLIEDSEHKTEDKDLVYGVSWDGKKHDFQASYNADLNKGAGGKYIYLKLDYSQREVVIAQAKEMGVISDLMVVAADNPATAKALLEVQGNTSEGKKEAYQLLTSKSGAPLNLNEGAGGKCVYIGYRTSMSTYDAITGVVIYKGQLQPGATFQLGGATYQAAAYMGSSGDLNANAGGDYLYLCYTRDGNTSSGEALTGLSAVVEKGGESETGEYENIKCWDGSNLLKSIDANSGAGGKYIYLKAEYKGFVADGEIPDEYQTTVPEYPYQLAIAGSNDAAEAQLQLLRAGYTLVTTDLNGAGRGQRIYMGYTTTKSAKSAIKQILVRHDGREDKESITYNIDGCDYVKATNLNNSVSRCGDLNAGANGDYIYLYSTRDLLESGEYVKAIRVLDRDHSVQGGNEYAHFFDSEKVREEVADLDVMTTTGRYIYIKKELGTSQECILPEQYIIDLMVAGGSSREEAKQHLIDAGYKVWNVNINEKQGVGHPVYIGYKATDTPNDKCITGIMLYRTERDMEEINFTYEGKYYEQCRYQEGMSEHGTLKPDGMQTGGANYYLCVTRSNELNGGRMAVTNRARIHTSKANGPYVGSFNPEEAGVVANFDLKAGGYGNSSWIYAPTKKVDPQTVSTPVGPIQNTWPFWTEVGLSNSRRGADKAKEALKNNHFTPFDVDLNLGSAVWSYMGYKCATGNAGWNATAIDQIAIYRRSNSWSGLTQYIDGKLWYKATLCNGGNGDMNEGHGGDYLYLVYTKVPVRQAQRTLVGMQSVSDEKYRANLHYMPYITDSGKYPPVGDTNNGKGHPTYLKPVYREYQADDVPANIQDNSKFKYISEVAVAVRWYASDAREELRQNGYTPIEVDLCGSGYVAYLGYKTTDDKDKAITDLVFTSSDWAFSYVRFKLDNKVYERCRDFGGNSGDLRTGSGGKNYYLCYTRDSDDKSKPLTTDMMVIDVESATESNFAIKEVSLDGAPTRKENKAIIDTNDRKVYILANKDESVTLMAKNSYRKSDNSSILKELVTCGAITESGTWDDRNFKKLCLRNGIDYRRHVDLNKGASGRYVYMGANSNGNGSCVDDVVIYVGKLGRNDDYPTIARTKWSRATIAYGSGNLNEGAAGDNLFLLYTTSQTSNYLRNGSLSVVVSSNRQYDYRFAEYLTGDGNRSPNADLNKGATGPHIYLRCEFDNK